MSDEKNAEKSRFEHVITELKIMQDKTLKVIRERDNAYKCVSQLHKDLTDLASGKVDACSVCANFGKCMKYNGQRTVCGSFVPRASCQSITEKRN